MGIVIDQVVGVLASYREEKIGLQGLVRAVDALRDYTEVAPAEVEQIYTDLEIINATRLDEGRALTSDEDMQIRDLLERLQALIDRDGSPDEKGVSEGARDPATGRIDDY